MIMTIWWDGVDPHLPWAYEVIFRGDTETGCDSSIAECLKSIDCFIHSAPMRSLEQKATQWRRDSHG